MPAWARMLGPVNPTSATRPVRIFGVGLNQRMTGALARYLSGDARTALVGVAPSLSVAITMLQRMEADLVLVDWSVLNGSARDTVATLRSGRPGLRIVGVASEREAYRTAVVQVGADAVISSGGIAVELEVLLRDFYPVRFEAAEGRNEATVHWDERGP